MNKENMEHTDIIESISLETAIEANGIVIETDPCISETPSEVTLYEIK